MNLYEFVRLSCDNYEINVFNIKTGKEIIHQVGTEDLDNYCYDNDLKGIMYAEIESWDIDPIKKEFCINIEW